MKRKNSEIYVIGVGPGTPDYLLPAAKRAIEGSDCLIGAPRHLVSFTHLEKEEFPLSGQFDKAIRYIKKFRDIKKIAVLVSGDPGIHSLLEKLSKVFKPGDYHVIPGISSLQLAFARIGESWHDAKIISLHGRRHRGIAAEIKASNKVFLFTDDVLPPNKIASELLKNGVDNRRVIVFERLSYPEERFVDTDLKRLCRMKGFGLSVMIIKKNVGDKAKGKLYGIGIGPGDPKLITLKAKEILDTADVIFVPKSGEDDRSCARSIVEAVATGEKTFLELTFPMTKDRAILNKYWGRAAQTVAKHVRKGRRAAFVTIGDPLIYSTYIYLVKMLRRDFPYVDIENIPGISSINAASSAAKLSLVEGDDRMAIVPVTRDLSALREPLEKFDTIVLMKVGSKLSGIIALLKELGLVKKSVLVSRVGHKDEKIVYDLNTLRGKKAGYMSVIIVKKGSA